VSPSLGCMGMSTSTGPPMKPHISAWLNAALTSGINFLDTAGRVRHGANELLLAKILKTRRKDVVLATKFGNVRGHDGAFLGINGKT